MKESLLFLSTQQQQKKKKKKSINQVLTKLQGSKKIRHAQFPTTRVPL